VDLDHDGTLDVLSGSWPGEVYWFRGLGKGKYAGGATIKDTDGRAIEVGRAAAAFAFDWDSDGDCDLIVGNILGEVHLVLNEGTASSPRFAHRGFLEADGTPIKIEHGDAGPVVADWDGDKKPDLIVGSGDGSVVWYRNIGEVNSPNLTRAETIVPASALGWNDDAERKPGQWGVRAKVCVTDWNGDGKLDILLGDICGGHLGKPALTDQEKREEIQARDELPRLKDQWNATYQDYRYLRQKLAMAKEPDPDGERKAKSLHAAMKRIKEEIIAVQKTQQRYKPRYQYHGFVWLFLRT
jgi:FG-GAP-like repeat